MVDARWQKSDERSAGRLQPSDMNAATIAQAGIPKAVSQPPVLRREPELADHAQPRGTPQRLTVWEERARKMGFPPSSR